MASNSVVDINAAIQASASAPQATTSQYTPTRPQVVNDVPGARSQANNVDVAASSQDIDIQIQQAKVEQAARMEAASSAVDIAEETRKTNERYAAASAKITGAIQGTVDTLRPVLNETYNTLANDYVKMDQLNKEDADTSGFNIFKKIAIAHEKGKTEREILATSDSYNGMMRVMNAATADVNSQLGQMKASYATEIQQISLDAQAKNAVATAAMENAKTAMSTSSYVAKTEMGVAADIYLRAHQALADSQSQQQLNLSKQELELRQKEYKAKGDALDAQANDIAVNHWLTLKGLDPKVSANRAIAVQAIDAMAKTDATKYVGFINQAANAAVAHDHVDVTAPNAPTQKDVARTVAINGTLQDVQTFAEIAGPENANLSLYRLSPETVDQIKKEENAKYMQAKQGGGTETVLDPVTKQPKVVPVKLTSKEQDEIDKNVQERINSTSARRVYESNVASLNTQVQRKFSLEPDTYINPDTVKAATVVLVKDQSFLETLSPAQQRVLSGVRFQNSMKGLPTIYTGTKAEGVMALAQQLLEQTTTLGPTEQADGVTSKEILKQDQALDLISKLFVATANITVPRTPELQSIIMQANADDVHKNAVKFKYSIVNDASKDHGVLGNYALDYFSPAKADYNNLTVIDLHDGASLSRGLLKRQAAIKEAEAQNKATLEARGGRTPDYTNSRPGLRYLLNK